MTLMYVQMQYNIEYKTSAGNQVRLRISSATSRNQGSLGDILDNILPRQARKGGNSVFANGSLLRQGAIVQVRGHGLCSAGTRGPNSTMLKEKHQVSMEMR